MFTVGQTVDSWNKVNGREFLTGQSTVERVTKCYVFARNKWGNVVKYHADGKIVGYHWLFSPYFIRPQV